MCFVRQEQFKRGVACADSDLLVQSCGSWSWAVWAVLGGLGRSWAVLGGLGLVADWALPTGCAMLIPCLFARREKRNCAEVPDVT